MEPRDDIHQQMLELIYGLLPDDESAALAQRISSDGRLARQYAELKERTDLLAEAAKAPVIPINASTQLPPLTDRMEAWKRAAEAEAGGAEAGGATDHRDGPTKKGAKSTTKSSTDRPERREGKKSAAWNGALYVLAGLAACLLVGAFGYPRLHQKNSPTLLALAQEQQALPQKFLAVSISGPAQLAPNQRNQFQAQLQTVAHEPLSGEVEFTFRNPAGNVVYSGRTIAKDGQAEWIIPPDELYDELNLEVVAAASGQQSRFSLPLQMAQPLIRATLETDRAMASPGQRLHFRGITLTEPNQHPVETEVQFALINPQGNRLELTDVERFSSGGVAAGSVPLDADASPGNHKLVMSSPNERFAPSVQTVRVAAPRSAPYLATWQFPQENYRPGSQVEGTLSLGGRDREALAERPLVLDLPTPQDSRRELTTDDQGRATVAFPLAEGQGPWLIAARDLETGWMTVTPVPSEPRATRVEFFPEGGPLVESLSNQVYFYARDAAGQPAPLAGKIKDDQGEVVAEVATTYEGRGSFRLVPEPERTYTFHSEEDKKTFELPVPQRIAAAMHVPQGVTRADQPLEVEVWPRREGIRLALIATQAGSVVGHEIWDAGRNIPIRQHISIPIPEQVSGVVELALHQLDPDDPAKSIPLGSRLVYRQPVQRLTIDVRPGMETYQGGELAELLVRTQDEFGYPVEAHLGLRVSAIAPLGADRPSQQPWGLDWSRRLVEHLEDPAALEGIRDELESGTFDPQRLDLILATDGPPAIGLSGQGFPGEGLLESSLLAALRVEEAGLSTIPRSIPVTDREWETLRSLAGDPRPQIAASGRAKVDQGMGDFARPTPLGQTVEGPLPVLSWSNRAEVVAQYRQALAPLEARWQVEIATARTISNWLTAVGGVLLGVALIGIWAAQSGVGFLWRRTSVVGLGLAVSLASLVWGFYWLGPLSPSGPDARILAYRDEETANRQERRPSATESTAQSQAADDRTESTRSFAAPEDDSLLGQRDAAIEQAERRGAAQSVMSQESQSSAAPESPIQPGIMSEAMELEMAAEGAPPEDQARESRPAAARAFAPQPARQRMSVPSEKAAPDNRLTEPTEEPILWRPSLRTDSQGEEKVTFSLPAGPGLYRVEVSGYGQGRIGSQVMTLRVE